MTQQWATVHSDGHQMWAYMCLPDGGGPHPGVVVIQHAPGVDEVIQELTRRLSIAGYAAIAPYLYHREDPDLNDPGGRRGRLKDRNIVNDVNATIELLRSHPAVRPDRIGITGFCMGGRVTYLMAATNPAIVAAANFYGGDVMLSWGDGPSPFDQSSNIRCPVIGFFGDDDPNPSPDDVKKINAELNRHGVVHESHSYAGAGHAFQNFITDRYRSDAARDSWEKLLAWFQRYLKA